MKHVTFYILSVILIFICSNAISQVTDNTIVKSLLGKSYFNTHPTLDSLGVWYRMHTLENKQARTYEDTRSKIYSISDSKGSVKVYFLKLDENKRIDEIVINFRHDNREQVEDESNMKGATDYHVGYYSTDIVFKWKK